MAATLVLNSSANGSASISRQLVDDVISQLRRQDPAMEFVVRDLDADPIPHLTHQTVAIARSTTPESEAHAAALATSDALIAELMAADTVVIGAPMYNFGIASTLKAWFDHVLRAGITFRYTEQGPVGLATGKKVIVVEARAGYYSEGPAVAMDSQEPHLRTMLGLMGMTDVTYIRAEKLAFGPEAVAAALEGARAEIDALGRETALAA